MRQNVLLIEDDPVSQDVIRALVESRGYHVDAVSDGFAGLKLLRERTYVAALVDYHLPEMDGYALARLIRDQSQEMNQSRLRLVGITADRHGLWARRGADALFDAVLAKPLEPDTLFASLDTFEPMPLAPSQQAAADLLRDPQVGRAGAAAEQFWRARGLAGRPKALVCSKPGPETAAALSLCFDLEGDPSNPEVILLTDIVGLAEIHALRTASASFLAPIIDVSRSLTHVADATFEASDPESWSNAAKIIGSFARRRARLDDAALASADPDLRLLVVLFVAERSLVLTPTGTGEFVPNYTGGFPRRTVLAAVSRLTQRGLLSQRSDGHASVLQLTERAIALVTGEPIANGFVQPWSTAGAEHGRAGLAADSSRMPPPERAPPRHDAGGRAVPPPAVPPARPLPTFDEAATSPIDSETFETLQGLIGRDRVLQLVARLSDQLSQLFGRRDQAEADSTTLASDAHKLVSAAGMLGFSSLSAACRDIERAALQGEDLAPRLATLKGERDRAVAAIARLEEAA